jgi:hypothetical protein
MRDTLAKCTQVIIVYGGGEFASSPGIDIRSKNVLTIGTYIEK